MLTAARAVVYTPAGALSRLRCGSNAAILAQSSRRCDLAAHLGLSVNLGNLVSWVKARPCDWVPCYAVNQLGSFGFARRCPRRCYVGEIARIIGPPLVTC